MKNFFKLILLLLCVFIIFNFPFTNEKPYSPENKYNSVINAIDKTYPKNQDTLRIMSYNLLADTPGFEGSPAYLRASGVCNILNTLKPDVAGLQEVGRNWFFSLNQGTTYNFISPVKTTVFGTMTAIIYNKETVILEDSGEYVFPETYNGKLRCAVWGLFKEKRSDKKFLVINTHLSLKENGIDSPLEQATNIIILANELKERFNCPLFFVGDFNSDKRSLYNTSSACIYETLCTVSTDTINLSCEKGFGENKNFSSYSADHIFLSGETDILRYVILSQPDFVDLSDHYPIFIDIKV